MTKLNFNQNDDEVSKLIDKMYEELMMLRYQLMTTKAKLTPDQKESLESKIEELNDNFENIVKSHTLYLKFKKATGQTNMSHSEELLKKIREISSNMGSIVSTVPRS